MSSQWLLETGSPGDHRKSTIPGRHETVSRAHDPQRFLWLGNLKYRVRILRINLKVERLNLCRGHVTDGVVRESNLAPARVDVKFHGWPLPCPSPASRRHERPGFLCRQIPITVTVGRRELSQQFAQLGFGL